MNPNDILKIIRAATLGLLLLFNGIASSQESEETFRFNMNQPMLINPALTGMGMGEGRFLRVGVNHRIQYPSMPRTMVLTGFGVDGYLDNIGLGFGLSGTRRSELEGIFTSTRIAANVSKCVVETNKVRLQIGAAFGIAGYRLNFRPIEFDPGIYPFLRATSEPIKRVEFKTQNFDIGVALSTNNFFVSAAASNLFRTEYSFYVPGEKWAYQQYSILSAGKIGLSKKQDKKFLVLGGGMNVQNRSFEATVYSGINLNRWFGRIGLSTMNRFHPRDNASYKLGRDFLPEYSSTIGFHGQIVSIGTILQVLHLNYRGWFHSWQLFMNVRLGKISNQSEGENESEFWLPPF